MSYLISDYNKVFSTSNSIRLLPTVKNYSNEEISNEKLYEVAMAYHLKEVVFSHNFHQILDSAKNHTFNARFFGLTKWSAIAVFLIGLLVNFFYHEEYRSELGEREFSPKQKKISILKFEVLQIK